MRRRGLDAYRRSAPWPGNDYSGTYELTRYDHYLVAATVPPTTISSG